jgi:mRNA-degrading endonuclease RelE of RelBE toxin-antitoxin system
MSEQKSEKKPPVSLGVDDLETALDLLTAEEGAVRADRRRLIVNLISNIAFGILLFACPLGLLVMWFDKAFGLGLLLAAGIATIVFRVAAFFKGAQPRLPVLSEEDEFAKAATAVWRKKVRIFYSSVGCLMAPGLVAVLVGLIWLGYSLFAMHKVSLPGLALIALPLLTLLVFTAVDEYRRFQYFSRVSITRDRFNSRLHKVRTEGLNEMSISSEEMDLLAQVETKQAVRKVAEAVKELPPQKWYSVAIAQKALGFMKGLPGEERGAIREITDALQLNPRPPEAQPVTGLENAFVIRSEDYEIAYLVDDIKQRVDVTEIRDTRGGEVPHAS